MGGKDFQEQLYRTHGQKQGAVESQEGDGDGWVGKGRWKRQKIILEQQ